jgi:tyrosyl-DNA phosphodiesterase 2
MDKVFFCGGLQCLKFERFGANVELEDDSERRHIVSLGFDRPWITDHLGVVAVFEVV